MTENQAKNTLWETRKTKAASWFAELRDDLCVKLESLEPDGARFERKK